MQPADRNQLSQQPQEYRRTRVLLLLQPGRCPLNEGLATIEPYAFYNCAFTAISIPNSVTALGSYTFSNCAKLLTVKIGTGITELADYLFNSCTTLKEIIIPQNIVSLGSSALGYCKGLKSVNIPNSVTSIGDRISRDAILWNPSFYPAMSPNWEPMLSIIAKIWSRQPSTPKYLHCPTTHSIIARN